MKGPTQLATGAPAVQEPEIMSMLISSQVGTFLESAGLPRAIGSIQNSSIIFARKGWAEDEFTVATITSFEVSMRRKTISLHLSSPRFLAGQKPIIWFTNGVWHLSVSGVKDYTFDDIEFKLF
jgi:hypothetical protein